MRFLNTSLMTLATLPFHLLPLDFFSLEALKSLAEHYGYWAVFLGILLENTGIPLPGETITLAGGFLAGTGHLKYELVFASAFSGAVLGDNFGYWIGKWGGWPILLQVGRLFHITEARLHEVRQQFGQNAGKAVLLGRFVTLLRMFAGPLAGLSGMPYLKFLAYNMVGAALWAAAIVSLAFFAGQFIPLAQLVGWVAQFGVFILIGGIVWLGLTVVSYSPKRLQLKRYNDIQNVQL